MSLVTPWGYAISTTAHLLIAVFSSPQKIFPLSPETEGKKGDSLTAERRGVPFATATAAITLAASLRSKTIQTISYVNPVGENRHAKKEKNMLAIFPFILHSEEYG